MTTPLPDPTSIGTAAPADPPAPRTARRWPVAVAVVVTVLAWASAFLVIRGAAEHLPPGPLALARLLVGTVVLGVVVALGRRWVRMRPRDWLLVAAFGVAWFGAYNVALNAAEQVLDAGTTAMLVNIGPILIALGAALVLGEGLPRWLAIGAGVAFVGVLLIGLAAGGGGGDLGGILLALVAALTYTIGVLVQKPLLARVPAAQVTFLGCAAGALVCLPYLPQLLSSLGSAAAATIWGAVYLGVVPTAIAFSTWAYALGRMPAGRLGVTTYIVPVLVIVFGLLVFGEVPAPLAFVGGALCLLGVALSRRRGRVRAPRA